MTAVANNSAPLSNNAAYQQPAPTDDMPDIVKQYLANPGTQTDGPDTLPPNVSTTPDERNGGPTTTPPNVPTTPDGKSAPAPRPANPNGRWVWIPTPRSGCCNVYTPQWQNTTQCQGMQAQVQNWMRCCLKQYPQYSQWQCGTPQFKPTNCFPTKPQSPTNCFPAKPAPPKVVECPPPPPKPQETYTVVCGDNLSKIACKYGITWQQLYWENKDQIKHPDLIYPGQVFKIPCADSEVPKFSYTPLPRNKGGDPCPTTPPKSPPTPPTLPPAAPPKVEQPPSKVPDKTPPPPPAKDEKGNATVEQGPPPSPVPPASTGGTQTPPPPPTQQGPNDLPPPR